MYILYSYVHAQLQVRNSSYSYIRWYYNMYIDIVIDIYTCTDMYVATYTYTTI